MKNDIHYYWETWKQDSICGREIKRKSDALKNFEIDSKENGMTFGSKQSEKNINATRIGSI